MPERLNRITLDPSIRSGNTLHFICFTAFPYLFNPKFTDIA